ncbi:MAG: hypothetical protein SXQ77_10695 [Halobacteria archaeon]|nr:hypothetical protein [Halobacteria archaeon]
MPYGVKPEEVKDAIVEFYDFYSDLNEFLMQSGHGRIETILRANNALSDFVGNVVTETLASKSEVLIHNQKQDGFPDLLPLEHYDDYQVHHGDYGIETKCSKSNGGWQAHNNESAWFMIFRYVRGDSDVSSDEMEPIRFVQVLCANLDEDDWSHSGRSDESRRTITSSIISSGMDKLRSNPVYEDPGYITGRGKKKVEYYRNHAKFDPGFAENNPQYVDE